MSARATQSHDKEVGRRLKVRRLELDMSQQYLGDALGLTFQQVQKYEKGTNRISAGRLQQVAKILDVPVSYFFDDNLGGSSGGNELFSLLETAYALRLLRAFVRITDRRIQHSMVELVEQLADATDRRRS